MNKKEILEIRKQFTPETSRITRICGCYVDGEKVKQLKMKQAFLSLPKEEAFKYCDIFRHTLSGTLGKNLLNLEFPLEEEKEEGAQAFLLKLRDSKLADEALLEAFYDKVIASYPCPENYYIILIHAAYDIPGMSSDGTEMFDASDCVYEYLLCSLCPVTLSKPGLSYNSEKNSIEDRIRDWVVDAPAKGFLFPAFNDRNSDIHNILYYTKKAEELMPELLEGLLGCAAIPLSADNQKEVFNTLIAETLGENNRYETVRSIHETLNDMLEENKDEPEPLTLTPSTVKRIFEQSGVPQEKVEHLDEQFKELAGEKPSLIAANLPGARQFLIQTPDIVIKVNPDRSDLIETRILDGRPCLVIPVEDQIEVNGLPVRTMFPTQTP
ncbi:MAG: DUF4317 domain-containing protein [Lachnospiraceae bacterium]|nr:DUF4317 domain-containing protein [Lachnospiraceae bacterium]